MPSVTFSVLVFLQQAKNLIPGTAFSVCRFMSQVNMLFQILRKWFTKSAAEALSHSQVDRCWILLAWLYRLSLSLSFKAYQQALAQEYYYTQIRSGSYPIRVRMFIIGKKTSGVNPDFQFCFRPYPDSGKWQCSSMFRRRCLARILSRSFLNLTRRESIPCWISHIWVKLIVEDIVTGRFFKGSPG